jgi:hypothetical protein
MDIVSPKISFNPVSKPSGGYKLSARYERRIFWILESTGMADTLRGVNAFLARFSKYCMESSTDNPAMNIARIIRPPDIFFCQSRTCLKLHTYLNLCQKQHQNFPELDKEGQFDPEGLVETSEAQFHDSLHHQD